MRLPRTFPVRTRRGFSLLEILVALAVAMTFLGAVYSSFIQILRASEKARARMEALRNARSAMMTFVDEAKTITAFGSSFLIGLSNELAYGDGVDNDDDGRIDEEKVDGIDNDRDWVGNRDDLHARIPGRQTFYDRFTYSLQPPFNTLYGTQQEDLGDFRVDEDVKFGQDTLIFRIRPTRPIDDFLFRTITYRLGTVDNQPNVLIRVSRTEFRPGSGRAPIESVSPLSFNCFGFDLLYWDPNGDPDPSLTRVNRPYWVETWNSNNALSFDPPQLPLPAAIFMMVTNYADAKPLSVYAPGKKIDVIRIPTMVDIEPIINNVFYPRPSL